MKNTRAILSILLVIALIATVIILFLRSRAKSLQTTGEDPLKLFGPSPENGPSTSRPVYDLTPDQRERLAVACSIPTSRATVEHVYKLKCADYGY